MFELELVRSALHAHLVTWWLAWVRCGFIERGSARSHAVKRGVDEGDRRSPGASRSPLLSPERKTDTPKHPPSQPIWDSGTGSFQ